LLVSFGVEFEQNFLIVLKIDLG